MNARLRRIEGIQIGSLEARRRRSRSAPKPLFRTLRYLLALGTLGFGLYSANAFRQGFDDKWVIFAAALYALPLLLQVIPARWIQISALWAGAFLVFQALVSPSVLGDALHFRTLPPNLGYSVNVIGNGIPGVVGVQRISTDAKGFRVIPPVDYEQKNGYRIFAIGGSTTEDIILDDAATWTHRLQEDLEEAMNSPVEVINTGVSGLRAIHHVATLRRILRYEPDMVLFMVGVNDWNRHIREQFGSQTYDDRGLAFRNTVLGRAAQSLSGLRWRVAAASRGQIENRGEYYAAKRNSLARPVMRTLTPDTVQDEYAKSLQAISQTCREAGVPCVFITQPNGYSPAADEDFRRGFWMTPPNESYTLSFESLVYVARLYNDFLTDFANRNGHPVLDPAATLPPSFDHFYDDVHFNANGARAVARTLARGLVELIGDPGAKVAAGRSDRVKEEGDL